VAKNRDIEDSASHVEFSIRGASFGDEDTTGAGLVCVGARPRLGRTGLSKVAFAEELSF
jgi:hypothetical protein